MTTLVLEDSSGERHVVTLPGPGGEVNFGVGEPGHRSAVWKVWARRGKSDVYAAVRDIGGFQKFSLHETGDWRYQWVTHDRTAPHVARTGSRVIDRWPRPDEMAPGLTYGLTVWVPERHVLEVPDDLQVPADVCWLPKPLPGHAAAVRIVLMKPDQGGINLQGARPFEGFDLAGGEVVLLLVGYHRLPEESLAWLHEEHRRALIMARLAGINLGDSGSERMMLLGHDTGGMRLVWDLAVCPRLD